MSYYLSSGTLNPTHSLTHWHVVCPRYQQEFVFVNMLCVLFIVAVGNISKNVTTRTAVVTFVFGTFVHFSLYFLYFVCGKFSKSTSLVVHLQNVDCKSDVRMCC